MNGWDSGGGECLNQKTVHSAAGRKALMAVTNGGPFYASMDRGSWAARSDDESSNSKLTGDR